MMKPVSYSTLLLSLLVLLSTCQKNTVSKIPQIALIYFEPGVMKANIDTCLIKFSMVDGDADIGSSDSSQIWIKDSRFDSAGFLNEAFPDNMSSVENPIKGLQGTCIFYPVPQPIPRADSLHSSPTGDTLSYEIYITDRAGHKSNHIFTKQVIIKP